MRQKKAKKGRDPPSVEQRMTRMTEELKLTDEQQPKVKAVLEASSKEMQGLRDLSREERRPKMQAIMDEEGKKLKDILTPDQYEKWQKMRDQMRKKGGGGPPPDGEKKSEPEKKD